MVAERFTEDKNYISFNSDLKQLKRKPIRQTYTVRGMDVMLPEGVSIRQAQEEFERFLFKNTQGCERGLITLPFIQDSNLLPIPFPRSFYSWEDSSKRLSHSGLFSTYDLKSNPKLPPQDFLGSMPSLLRTNYDSRYLPHVGKALDAVKTVKASVRAQLSKDYMLEEDEIRGDVKEKLSRMYEGIRGLEGGMDSSDEDHSGEDGSDY